MNFKEVKLRLDGYVTYCNIMLGSNLQMIRNKKLNQFEIINKGKKGDTGKIIMTVETGLIKEKLIIRCSNALEYYSELKNAYNGEIFLKLKEIEISVHTDKELFSLLQSLEQIGFFGNVRSF